ncbi:protein EMSY-LIKE 1-like isoform X1 [Tripterygium wilfordii]|uniref:protein EMSY-LIKE 1-like isoform X1 n=2 Tax=Tripterygium wilfordii TaxID=458696 RepID=UPI0018F83BD1|nr:protein EMSY-LIKE 1-like isoform X1 [Tripterygium wilfordii]
MISSDLERYLSLGTDDDLPSSHHNRISRRGHVTGNGTSVVGSAPYSLHSDMEAQIHALEQEAYIAVLRAFKAQSDAITWEKEGLITELRKELRVSDDKHRELLTRVNGDEIIQRIREWRQAGGNQAARFSASQPVHDIIPSPTVSASRKKQKTSQLGPGISSKNPMQYPSTGLAVNRRFMGHGTSGAFVSNEPAERATYDPLIGRKVWTRWPEDNNFYEAVITDHNPSEGRHALVYDINTASETWEWVDLKEISPEDIRWEGEDPGISHHGALGLQGHGINKPLSRGRFIPSVGRGTESLKEHSKIEFLPSQNGVPIKLADDIELLNTETLVREVEQIIVLSDPDPLELEKAQTMLKEQEQALINAIARLADASDGDGDGEQPLSNG